jgi:PAS domain S-box-containing protein
MFMVATNACHAALEKKCLALEAENTQLRAVASVVNDACNPLWQISPDLMLVAGTDGVILKINPAWTTTLGWTEKELVGRRLPEFVHPDDSDTTVEGARHHSEGGLRHLRNRYRHKDGSYRWIEWLAAPGEGVIHAVGHDRTLEKQQAKVLRQAEAALRQSQKMEAIGQLTSGLAHDFNNLLTGISGSLEVLQSRLPQEQTDDLAPYITAARVASKRAAALTHRLLAFSHKTNCAPKATDVNRLIASMEELIRRTMGPEIAVEVAMARGPWTTWIDPNQFENALLNLCINARDAMPKGGRLTIETVNIWLTERLARECDLPMGQYVALAVSDIGCGMSPAVVKRAFDPFFTTKVTGKGTGLGLSMVNDFVQQSGGQVQIESEVGHGTTICLYMPRHWGEADAAEAAEDMEITAALAEAPRADHGETVLVVDDEATVRELVSEVLEGLGYMVIAAADGMAGLEVLRSDRHIDLLVTDIGLPSGMDGQQLVEVGRALRPDIKVLFITGYLESAALNQHSPAPDTCVLAKPFTMNALAGQVKKLIGRTNRLLGQAATDR